MNDIADLAERLGKAIADSPQGSALREGRKVLQQDKDLSKLLEEFREQTQKIAKLETENKPVEVEDKHRFQELREKLTGCETFKKYTAAQVEYIDLMRKVNDALQKQLVETEEP